MIVNIARNVAVNKVSHLTDFLTRNPPVNLQDLEKLSWSGVPASLRSRVWKILCGYLPPGKSDEVVKRKREEYAGYVNQYFNNKEEDIHKDTFRSDISERRRRKTK